MGSIVSNTRHLELIEAVRNVDVKGSIEGCLQRCWEEECADMYFEESGVFDDGGVAETCMRELVAEMERLLIGNCSFFLRTWRMRILLSMIFCKR